MVGGPLEPVNSQSSRPIADPGRRRAVPGRAKTHLSALLAAVERGEEFVIARGDRPAARLVPMEPQESREMGFVSYSVPDEFLDALPEEELVAWEGNS
jgi:antitoxin (DNA-binding transcriptional repressor) of toxin-antitoxin stability system